MDGKIDKWIDRWIDKSVRFMDCPLNGYTCMEGRIDTPDGYIDSLTELPGRLLTRPM